MGTKTVLVISDTQSPYEHPDTLAFLAAVKRKYKPNKVVHIGDLVDAYQLGEYVRDPDAPNMREDLGRIQVFIKALGKMFPKMDIIRGNHERRLHRAFARAGISDVFMRDWGDVLDTPSAWRWHDEIEIDGILYQHGDETGAGGQAQAVKRCELNGRCTVAGHHHTNASIHFFANREVLLWGMHVGSLIDFKTMAFAYARKQLRKPIISIGLVIDKIPLLIPMELDSEGRWTGKL